MTKYKTEMKRESIAEEAAQAVPLEKVATQTPIA